MDKHLNIFDFFNNHDYEYYEDNLSRGMALCLKYDTVFLDNTLKTVLDAKIYSELFNTEFPDYSINIDIQKKLTELENFSNVYAVSCSVRPLDPKNIADVTAIITDSPITDLCIEINDTCIIFEFKRANEDCAAQLIGQVECLKDNCPKDVSISYIDLNWKKIIKILLNVLSLQKQINIENQFSADFVKFLEKRHPDWFPDRVLKNIPFPQSKEEPNYQHLDSRLNQIKSQVFGEENTKEFGGKRYRLIIEVDWGWCNEVHITPPFEAEKDSICTQVFIGDTKAQGRNYFNSHEKAPVFPNNLNNYRLKSIPYFKFSHFNSYLFWFCPNNEEYKLTHRQNFFNKYAGRYKKEQWRTFEKMMSSISPDWRNRCDYDEYITNSNRNYFDLSIGIMLKLYMPYSKAQEFDNQKINSKLVKEFRKNILALKRLIESHQT